MVGIRVFAPEIEDIVDAADAKCVMWGFVCVEEGVDVGFDGVTMLMYGGFELTEPCGSAFVVGAEFSEENFGVSVGLLVGGGDGGGEEFRVVALGVGAEEAEGVVDGAGVDAVKVGFGSEFGFVLGAGDFVRLDGVEEFGAGAVVEPVANLRLVDPKVFGYRVL